MGSRDSPFLRSGRRSRWGRDGGASERRIGTVSERIDEYSGWVFFAGRGFARSLMVLLRER